MATGNEDDYLAVDDLISVTLDHQGETEIVANVHWTSVSAKEAEPSNGALLAGDGIFVLSAREFQTEPKVGDVIIPEEGVDKNNILVIDNVRSLGLRRCYTRNIVLSENLRQTGDIEKRDLDPNATGDPVWIWGTEHEDVPCKVQRMTASLVEKYGVEGLQVEYVVYFDRTYDLTEDHRIVVDGGYYYPKAWTQPARLDVTFKAFCEKRSSDVSPMVRSSSLSLRESRSGATPRRRRVPSGGGSKRNNKRTKPDRQGTIRRRRTPKKG